MRQMLRHILSPKLFIATLLLSVAAAAQDGPPPENQPPRNDDRPNILAELGLSPDQIQQFRRNNQAHRPRMNQAQQRLREANRDLDLAIYADSADEGLIQTRLKAFQEAQAEVTRLRFANELNIRKILTPEQLVRFRDIRDRIAAAAAEKLRRQRRGPDQQRPIQNGLRPRQDPVNQQKRQPNTGSPLAQPVVRKGRGI